MISRRHLLAAAPAFLAACRAKEATAVSAVETPALKSVAPCPVGCAAMAHHLRDPVFAALLTRHFSQITPEWEMKMEYILPEGTSATDPSGWRWDRPDAIAAFAKTHGMRLHGHTLVWYAEKPPAFTAIDGQPNFEAAYRGYITEAASRFKGVATSWDVVNEPVKDDEPGLREHLWSKNLGQDEHMLIAYESAAAADPGAVLFLNDYFLEKTPRKRLDFMRLAERLLKKGAKLGGLGTQSHLDIDVAPGAVTACIKDLASLGLPIHVSELDISLSRKLLELRTVADQLQAQARLAGETAEAFMALPERQRFAFSAWGLRDSDSWLRSPPNAGDGTDQPLLFDDYGQPKPAFESIARAFAG